MEIKCCWVNAIPVCHDFVDPCARITNQWPIATPISAPSLEEIRPSNNWIHSGYLRIRCIQTGSKLQNTWVQKQHPAPPAKAKTTLPPVLAPPTWTSQQWSHGTCQNRKPKRDQGRPHEIIRVCSRNMTFSLSHLSCEKTMKVSVHPSFHQTLGGLELHCGRNWLQPAGTGSSSRTTNQIRSSSPTIMHLDSRCRWQSGYLADLVGI